jgi:SecD/SecF fusion protein
MPSSRHLFAAVVAVIIALMTATTPYLVQHTRIGLEFKGGYELTFAAEPLDPRVPVTHEQLLQTANLLGECANASGLAEPQVNLLGEDQIRLVLAGVKAGDPVIATLHDPSGMPVKLTEKYSETVGGVLGAQDLEDTLKAAGLAVALIFLFLAAVYRGPGLIAVFTVTVSLWLLLAIFNLTYATLSLAAIVAYVLGMGIASDANILAFERIRDELVDQPTGEAVISGGRKSFRTLVDSDATVLITALILLFVGIGPILGFALTTIFSIVASFLVNVLFSRLLMRLWYGGDPRRRSLFSPKRVDFTRLKLSYLGLGKAVMAVLLAFSLYGGYTIATQPLNYDIEFKAGTALDIQIDPSITQTDATDLIFGAGIAPATVAIGGQGQNQIAIRFDDVLTTNQVNSVVDQFRQIYGDSVTFAENTADPAVARHLVGQSIIVVLMALAGTFLFILVRFGPSYATASMIAVAASVWFVISTYAIFYLEIDITFIAAMLTVIGYVLNEVIVVFDRVRENLGQASHIAKRNPPVLIHTSIAQVLRRSLFTALTVMIGAACLYFFGAEPLQMFSLAIFLGLACGTLCSLFLSPLVFAWLKGMRTVTSENAALEASMASGE